jgi:hypothetical protein
MEKKLHNSHVLRDVSKIISRFGRPLFAAACVGKRLTYSNMRALRRLGSDKNRLAKTKELIFATSLNRSFIHKTSCSLEQRLQLLI